MFEGEPHGCLPEFWLGRARCTLNRRQQGFTSVLLVPRCASTVVPCARQSDRLVLSTTSVESIQGYIWNDSSMETYISIFKKLTAQIITCANANAYLQLTQPSRRWQFDARRGMPSDSVQVKACAFSSSSLPGMVLIALVEPKTKRTLHFLPLLQPISFQNI